MAGDDEWDEEDDGWTETDAETDAGGGRVLGKKEIVIISRIVGAAATEAVLEYQDQQFEGINYLNIVEK